MVELRQGRELAASTGSPNRYQRQRKLSGGANRLSRRRSLREMGGQTFADRSGVRIRRARRFVRKNVYMGRRISAARKVDGKHLAGKISGKGYGRRRLPWPRAGGEISGQWIRPLRHVRQRLGVVQRLVSS